MTLANSIAAALGQGKEQASGGGFVTLCPVHGETSQSTPSLSIKDSTDKQGNPDIIVYCHSGCDWKDIKKELVARSLMDKWKPDEKKTPAKSKTKPKPKAKPDKTKPEKPAPPEKDSFVWGAAKKNEESVSRYLANRSIIFSEDFTFPACLKWTQYTDKQSKEEVSAVVCAATKPTDDSVKAVQRLFIDTDDFTKSGAKMLGDMIGRGIWFRRKEDKATLLVGEGIETTLSAMFATGHNGVAALTRAGLVNIIFPEETTTIYILVDSDKAKDPAKKQSKGWPGQRAAIELAKRFREERAGNKAYFVTPNDSCFSDDPEKMDFNDLLQTDPTGKSISKRFEIALEPENLEWTPPGKDTTSNDSEEYRETEEDDGGFYPATTLERLHDMNKTYSAVLLGGKFRVIKETLDYAANRSTIDFLETTSFNHYLSNVKVPVRIAEDKIKMAPISQVWQQWEARKTFDNVAFSPGNNLPSSVYNLFRGFPIEPIEGDWSLMKDHIRENICGGDLRIFDYVMGWMARIIQDPGGKKPGVALVMKGGKGVGKGIFANAFGKLFGDAYLPIATPKGFTGQFNMHLSKCLCVFLDEAVWGGDKEVEGQLKALVTEPTMLFQPKGIDSIAMENHMNILMASNNDWVIPASIDERRFLVLLVSALQQQNSQYFKAIIDQQENGGAEAMMFELLHHDFSAVNLWKAPRTEGLTDQVSETLDPTLSFWKSAITRGFLLSDRLTSAPRKTDYSKSESGDWPQMAWKYELYHEFKEHFCGGRTYVNETKFWRDSMKFWPGGKPQSSRQRNADSVRYFNIVIPPMEELKTAFTELTGISLNDDIDLIDSDISMFNGQF